MTLRNLPGLARRLPAAAGLIALAFTTALLACAHLAPMPQDSGDRREIEAVLKKLEASIQAKDLDAILGLYSFSDSSAAARKREGYTIQGLDSLTCRTHLGELQARGNKAVGMLLVELAYSENGRRQAMANWNRVELRRIKGAWKIISDDGCDPFRARFTDLRVNLEPDSASMSGSATIQMGVSTPGADQIILGLNRGLSIRHARDGAGRELTPIRTADVVILPLGGLIGRGDSVSLTVDFAGSLFNESKEQGYSQVSIAPEGCFASWVTSWYPHLPGTGSKSTGKLEFNVPAGFTVAASGAPSGRRTTGGRETQTFSVGTPLDFSFAAAHYFHREQVVDNVTIGVYFLKGGDRKADLYESACARILACERRLYGMYPFDGYAIVEIPSEATGTLGGSSEQGMNLFPMGMLPDSTLPLPLLAHEMGHSWWGNYILSGDGAIVSEGLAQLTGALVIRDSEGDSGLRRFLKYGRPDYGQSARLYFEAFAPVPIRDLPLASRNRGSAERSVLHDLADVKGHFVYNMLRENIGDDAFFAGLRAIIARGPGKAVGLQDLQAEWERAGGRKLGSFFDQWFHRSGAPEFAFSDSLVSEAGGLLLRGRITQLREPYDVEAEVVVVEDIGPMVHKVHVTGKETPFSFALSARPKAVLFDPDYKIFRWCGEFEDSQLMQEVKSLRSLDRQEAALPKLEEYLKKVPDAADALYQTGLCLEESGKPAEAEERYRTVWEQYATYPSYNPSVPLATLHLGQVCDLQDRRDEALEWYRRVLDLPDVQGSRQQAGACANEPYRAPPRRVPPAEDALRQYAGAYADPVLGAVDVTFKDGELQVASSAQGVHSGLAWVDGAVFQLTARDGVTMEFVPGAEGRVREAVLRIGGREFHLNRATEVR